MTDYKINERIKELINALDLTPYKFSQMLGNKKEDPTIYRIVNNKFGVNYKIITKIKETFPDVNESWLLMGEGSMFINSSSVTNKQSSDEARIKEAMAVKERLTAYIKYKKISISAFCRTIGVSNAFVSSMRKSLQPEKIENIAIYYPDLNISWLLTGEGEMLKNRSPQGGGQKNTTTNQTNKPMDEIVKALTRTIDVLDGTVSVLNGTVEATNGIIKKQEERIGLLEEELQEVRSELAAVSVEGSQKREGKIA